MGNVLYTIVQHGPTNLQSFHFGKKVSALGNKQVIIALPLSISNIVAVHSGIMSISDEFYAFAEVAEKGGVM